MQPLWRRYVHGCGLWQEAGNCGKQASTMLFTIAACTPQNPLVPAASQCSTA